jgi:hypothetical protein
MPGKTLSDVDLLSKMQHKEQGKDKRQLGKQMELDKLELDTMEQSKRESGRTVLGKRPCRCRKSS